MLRADSVKLGMKRLTQDTFTSFKSLLIKNFNRLIFSFKEIILRVFLVKTIVCLAMFHLTLEKIHSLILPIFFFAKLPSLKVYIKFLGRRIQNRIQNPVEDRRLIFLRKRFMNFSR